MTKVDFINLYMRELVPWYSLGGGPFLPRDYQRFALKAWVEWDEKIHPSDLANRHIEEWASATEKRRKEMREDPRYEPPYKYYA